MEDKEILQIYNETGEKLEIEVLNIFELDSTNKSYIVYKDNQDEEESDKVLITVAELDNLEDKIILKDISDKNVIDQITNKIKELIK